MDLKPQKYNFDNPAEFFNEPLPYKEDFIDAFKTYCLENSFPIEINDKNQVIDIKEKVTTTTRSKAYFNKVMI